MKKAALPRAVSERDMMRVAGMNEEDPCVLVPAHVARGMAAAKEEAVVEMMVRVTPKDEGFERAVLMAAGYLQACAEFQALWARLLAKGRDGGER